ncbi:hypothetical protein AB0M28_28170 [Streptomyces sp. NPDC051940]|uniref:hypothetical protein n=1 Tax=Streptomyces sp. NPDC051940 TaxID=3155675 RepID=UPI00342BD334
MGHEAQLHELLEQVGLAVVGETDPDEGLLPPDAAWRIAEGVIVAAAEGEAIGTDPERWPTRAHHLIDGRGEFLVAVRGCHTGGNEALWTRVRAAGDAPVGPACLTELAGPTADRAVVALSTDGESLVGIVRGGEGPRVTVLDRLTARLEEAAEAAGRETPEERAAVWAALPGRGAVPADQWIRGLSGNNTTPPDMVLRLLEVYPYAVYGDRTPEVLDAVIAHPDAKLRRRLTHPWHRLLTPDQIRRLVIGEQSALHRAFLAEAACDHGVDLPDEVYDDLMSTPHRAVLAARPELPAHHRLALAEDPDAGVRRAVCMAWELLPAPVRERLLADPVEHVREGALLAHHEEHPMPRAVFASLVSPADAARRCSLTPGLEAELAVHEDVAIRRALTDNPRLGPRGVALLAEDADDAIRAAIAVHPQLTEDQRAAVHYEFDPATVSHDLPWVAALHDDPEAMRRLSVSSHPRIRRSVARARHLPPDVVARLAGDRDRLVRLFLAESCDDAPAEVLMEVWRWWDGSLSHPDRPRSHPNFPREDLLRYLDDPGPRMRRLALDDPESTPAHVARLARDPAPEVRHRAVTDPRLSAADAVRLLSDPVHYVRSCALIHPNLPARTLSRLLLHPPSAETAARNRAVPAPVLRRLADVALARHNRP